MVADVGVTHLVCAVSLKLRADAIKLSIWLDDFFLRGFLGGLF